NKLGFAGKQFDPATGLSYMGARYYDPVLGRFRGVDPVAFQEANVHSFNRYAYANNNPYKYVDRDGRYAELAIEVVSLSVGYMSLRENMRAGNTMAAITDGVGMLADIAGAALPGVPGVAGLSIKASRAAAEQTYEISDGVRRAKAAELLGKKTVPANIFSPDGKLIGQGDIPISALRSPHKDSVDMSNQINVDRYMSVQKGMQQGDDIPRIDVTPGNRGVSVKDIKFDTTGGAR
ncbi:MAG: RHS repeat-associated core domain-containing protein, partial [Pseudomonadota bacterium]